MGMFIDVCPVCLRVQISSVKICDVCRQTLVHKPLIYRDLSFGVFSLFSYQGQSKNVIGQLKGGKNKNVIYDLSKILIINLLKQANVPIHTIIIPAPPKILNQKDHGAVIADSLGELLSVPVAHNILKRVDTHVDQKEKSEALRFQTKIDFQNESSERLNNKNIILVDDVVTTGATLLKMKKCFPNKNVIGLTLASTASRF